MDRRAISSIVSGERVDKRLQKLGAIVGSGAFFGITSVTMPGIKIGKNCQVGPGVVVYEDLPGESSFFVKQPCSIKNLKYERKP